MQTSISLPAYVNGPVAPAKPVKRLSFEQIREQIKMAIASGGYEAWAEYRDLLVSLCPQDDFDNPYAGCSDPKSRDEANGIYR